MELINDYQHENSVRCGAGNVPVPKTSVCGDKRKLCDSRSTQTATRGMKLSKVSVSPAFMHNETPVFKVATGKFIYVKKLAGKPSVILRSWEVKQERWHEVWSSIVALDLDQFLLLTSIMLDGRADCPRYLLNHHERLLHGPEPEMLHLLRNVYVTWTPM